MFVRFLESTAIGFRVYSPGEIADLPDETVAQLIRDGIAVDVAPAGVREATDQAVQSARRMTKRGPNHAG